VTTTPPRRRIPRGSGRSRCRPSWAEPSGIRHIPNRVTPWPPLAAGCRASYAYASEVRDNARASMWYAPCPLRSLMEWAVVLFPVLSAAAGYLLDGVHVQDIARAFAK
jgi:hypothetical protein